MGSLMRATSLRGYDELVVELGGDPVALLERFGIAASIDREPGSFVPFRSVAMLVEETAAVLGLPDFGLRLSRVQGLDVLGPVAVIARNAETVLDAMESIGRYLHVHSPALHLSRSARGPGEGVTLVVTISEPGIGEGAQAHELTLANGIQILRLLGGPGASAESVSFRHRPLSTPETYEAALGCQVLFEQVECRLVIPDEVAVREIDNADPETRRVAAAYLDQHVVPPTSELPDRVLELIRQLLPLAETSVETVADHIGVHPRTLQRQLGEHGTSFRDLVDQERRDQSRRLLAERDLSMGQVAGLLGYAEQSAFTRAVRRWFGAAPSQVRIRLADHAAPPPVWSQ